MAHDFGTATGAPSPTMVGKSTGRAPRRLEVERNRIPHPANVPFYLKWHPMRWQLIEGEWLPLLGKMRIDPGLNGVDRSGDDTLCRVNNQKKGWRILPWECCPPNTPGGVYIAEHDCMQGVHYCEAWETPRHLGTRVLPSVIDTEGYVNFLRWLVREGHVVHPDNAVIEMKVDVQKDKIERMMRDAHRPGMEGKIQDENERLDDMKSAPVGGAREKRGTLEVGDE